MNKDWLIFKCSCFFNEISKFLILFVMVDLEGDIELVI